MTKTPGTQGSGPVGERPANSPVSHVPHLEDTISDPAFNDTLGHDWAGEGGALLTGPVNSKRTKSKKRKKALA